MSRLPPDPSPRRRGRVPRHEPRRGHHQIRPLPRNRSDQTSCLRFRGPTPTALADALSVSLTDHGGQWVLRRAGTHVVGRAPGESGARQPASIVDTNPRPTAQGPRLRDDRSRTARGFVSLLTGACSLADRSPPCATSRRMARVRDRGRPRRRVRSARRLRPPLSARWDVCPGVSPHPARPGEHRR